MSAISSILLYTVVFGLSAFIIQFGYKHKSKTLQGVGLLFPILLGGLRYDVGLDYMSYFNAYADIVNPQSTLRYEGTPGLEITFRIIAHISDFLISSPVLLFTVYCAITVLAFYAALRVMRPKNVGFAMFFFYTIFFLNSFNIMRQGAAMSISSLALVYYARGRKKKSLALILLASLFHISALLLLLYVFIEYLMERHYLRRRRIAKFSRLFIKLFLISIFVVVIGLSVTAVGLYVYEVTGRIGDYDMKLSLGVVFKYILTVVCAYSAIYAWGKFDVPQKRIALFVSLGMIVYSLGIIHNEAARIGMYLIVLAPILSASTYDFLGMNRFRNKFMISVGVVVLSFLYVVSVHIGGGDGVRYNYQSIIESSDYKQAVMEFNTR